MFVVPWHINRNTFFYMKENKTTDEKIFQCRYINMMFDKAHVYGMIKQGDTYKKGKRIGTLDASNGLYKIDNNFFKYRFQLERICA